MKTFSHTFSAGETQTFPGGSRFEILSALDALDVTYIVNGGQAYDEVANGVPPGYYFTMPQAQELKIIDGKQILVPYPMEFERVEVYSATAQNVVIGISRGDSGARGSNISLQGGKIDEIGANTMRTTLYASQITANATIVAPAANINGILVSYAVCLASGAGTGRILADTSAPVNWWDGNTLALFQNASGTGAMQYPIIVPQGFGIYTISSALPGPWALMEYEIL